MIYKLSDIVLAWLLYAAQVAVPLLYFFLSRFIQEIPSLHIIYRSKQQNTPKGGDGFAFVNE